MSLFYILWENMECSDYKGSIITHKLILGSHTSLGGWSRGVPLYTEVSSFQGVGVEVFHCIQRCPHFRGLE